MRRSVRALQRRSVARRSRSRVTLVRPHTLASAISREVPDLVAAPTEAGSDELLVSAPGLIGRVPSGLQLDVAGETTLTAAATARAAADQIAIPLAQPIAIPLAGGEAVTVEDGVTWQMRAALSRRDLLEEGDLEREDLVLKVVGPQAQAPAEGDLITVPGRDALRVRTVRQDGGDPALGGAWIVAAGES